MADTILAVAEDSALLAIAEGRVRPKLLGSVDDMIRAFEGYRKALWLVSDAACLMKAAGRSRAGRTLHRLLALGELSDARRGVLRGVFGSVLAPGDGVELLPPHELVEALGHEYPDELLVGAAADPESRTAVLFRGNLESIVVNASMFPVPGTGEVPDFGDVEVIDHGVALRLGEYEAATDAILYDVDPVYRKRAKARQIDLDDSFGGALRRLRLERRVLRDDFPGLSEKEVARIERGEVKKPHRATILKLARRLGVKPNEIETF